MASPSIEASYQRRWHVLAVLCLSVFLLVVSNMALNVALPSLGEDLHASTSSLAWIVDSYVLCFAGLLLPAGAIGDRFGRKGALQCGLVVFLAAAVAGAFASTTGQLIAARAVMGVGAAFVMSGTLSILATVFPPAERPKAIAIWASVAGAAVAVSITWSGFMLEHFWWGSIFLGMAAVAVLALVAGRWLLPTSRHPDDARLDPVGAALSAIAATGLLYGFIQAPEYGWTAGRIVVAFAVGVVGLAGFAVWERSRAHPMLDVGLFSNRHFSVGATSIAAAYFALFGTYFVLTQYLQLVRGYSPITAGLYALPAGLAQFAVANFAKPLVSRYGLRPVLTGGLICSASGLLTVAMADTTSPILVVEAGLALLGAGIGLAMPPATGAIMTSLPPHKAGVGSAVNDLVRELGGAFGIGLLGSLAVSRYRSRLAPTLATKSSEVAARSHAGLAQALDSLGGPHTTAGTAARHAFSSGLSLAMLVGAAVVLAAAGAVFMALPPRAGSGTADPTSPAEQPPLLADSDGVTTSPNSIPTKGTTT
jgi:EmrB/QacA subfamily drug resistance transporter